MSDQDRLADVRAALDEEVSDLEEQRQLLAVADGLDRHYQGRRRGAWVFTAGAVAASLALLVGGAYAVLGQAHLTVPSTTQASAAAVTAAVPMAASVPASKLNAAWRPTGVASNTPMGLLAGPLSDGDVAVVVWNFDANSTMPLEEVVVPTKSAILAPSVEQTAWIPVTSRQLFTNLGPTNVTGWGSVIRMWKLGQAPNISFAALPSGSFPGLPLVPIRYAAGTAKLAGGRLVLVEVPGVNPSYWLINTDGEVMAAGDTLPAPLASYAPVQHGVAALASLLNL